MTRSFELNRGSAPLFLERSRGVFLHAGPGHAAVGGVKALSRRSCGTARRSSTARTLTSRLSGRRLGTTPGSGTVFIHVLPPSVERSIDAGATTRHRMRGFDGAADSLARCARPTRSGGRDRLARPHRRSAEAMAPEARGGRRWRRRCFRRSPREAAPSGFAAPRSRRTRPELGLLQETSLRLRFQVLGAAVLGSAEGSGFGTNAGSQVPVPASAPGSLLALRLCVRTSPVARSPERAGRSG